MSVCGKSQRVQKSLSEIIDLQLCMQRIPQDCEIDLKHNTITNIDRSYSNIVIYGKHLYGNHLNIDKVCLKIMIHHSKHNNGYEMYFGVAESDYSVSKFREIWRDQGIHAYANTQKKINKMHAKKNKMCAKKKRTQIPSLTQPTIQKKIEKKTIKGCLYTMDAIGRHTMLANLKNMAINGVLTEI